MLNIYIFFFLPDGINTHTLIIYYQNYNWILSDLFFYILYGCMRMCGEGVRGGEYAEYSLILESLHVKHICQKS